LALSLQNRQANSVGSTQEPLNHQQVSLDEQQEEEPVDEPDDDDVEIATDSEEGELDNSKPPPKVLTAAQRKKQKRKEKVLTDGRGPVLCTIAPSDVDPYPSHRESKVTWNDDPELLCSYNWSSVVDNKNTIFVPGGPSKWTPQTVPYNVPGDQGFHPTDYNYVRQPRDPFSAIFHAMAVMNPDYAFNNVDVLADRNNLRVLLEFVQVRPSDLFVSIFTRSSALLLSFAAKMGSGGGQTVPAAATTSKSTSQRLHQTWMMRHRTTAL
jgi:hypothetical protein